MAIAAGAAGAWAAVNATTQTVTLPSHAAGNLLILIAACKAATITSADPTITTPASGWSRFATFADGTTNTGNGTGSVRQAIFWREATSNAETNPVVTWGGSQTSTPGIAVALCFTKASTEDWVTPVAVQAATNNATGISVTMGSNPGITANDWGIVTHTTRDDSALTVPSWTATGATLSAVTEFPATAIASGTSDDMAGDAAYRSVTSGTASAAPVVTGTQAAAETGVSAFIRLRVNGNRTVTPTTASIVTATFAPTIAHQITGASPTALTTSTFAPTIAHVINGASPTALTTSTFAPTVTATNNQLVTPTTASLSTAAFAPTVTTPTTVTPDLATLTTSAFAPTVSTSDHQTATPTTASVALSLFAPTVTATANVAVTPDVAAITLSTFAPTLGLSDNQTVSPGLLELVTVTFAPTVTTSNHQLAVPPTGVLTLTTFAPTVEVPGSAEVIPLTAALTLTTFAPSVRVPGETSIAILPVVSGTVAIEGGSGTVISSDGVNATASISIGVRGTIEVE